MSREDTFHKKRKFKRRDFQRCVHYGDEQNYICVCTGLCEQATLSLKAVFVLKYRFETAAIILEVIIRYN
jgi:hypothetical protein